MKKEETKTGKEFNREEVLDIIDEKDWEEFIEYESQQANLQDVDLKVDLKRMFHEYEMQKNDPITDHIKWWEKF